LQAERTHVSVAVSQWALTMPQSNCYGVAGRPWFNGANLRQSQSNLNPMQLVASNR
jgi:hypothetical protein